MSRLSGEKTTVQIVCPHCRRSYEFKVDLKRIYHTKPRAVCSRCGGKFEVIQRMSEIDDESAASSDLSDRTTPSIDKGRQQQSPRDSSLPVASESIPKETKRDGSPESPDLGTEEKSVPQGASAESPKHPSIIFRNESSQKIAVAKAERETVEPPPEEFETEQASPPIAPMSPPPSPPFDDVQPHHEDGTSPQGPRAPSWPETGTFSSAGELRAPTAADLENPMPWVTGSDSSLAIFLPKLPQSVIALERLLTEHSRRSSSGGVGLPSIASDVTDDEAAATVVPAVKTR